MTVILEVEDVTCKMSKGQQVSPDQSLVLVLACVLLGYASDKTDNLAQVLLIPFLGWANTQFVLHGCNT